MKKILVVTTRDIHDSGTYGRTKTLKRILEATGVSKSNTLFRVKSLLEQKSYVTLGAAFISKFAFAKTNKRWPLQCILFNDLKTCNTLEAMIERERPSAVYFDMVRCFTFIQRIAQRFPEITLICDFDDLMSRRMRLVRDLNEALLIGYLRKFVWGWIARLIENKFISNLVLEHEASALSRVEAEIARLVHNIVLVSAVDADALREDIGAQVQCEITSILPPFAAKRQVAVKHEGLRFVFIGSDRLLQNRLSIRMLLSIWTLHQISFPLYIYGHQTVSKVDSANVFWPGFAESLDDVYTRNSILIAPAGIGGGVKTKILEALEFGNLPLGNQISFEGIGDSHGLAMTEDELIYTLTHLQDRIPSLVQAAQNLQDRLTAQNSFHSFRSRWLQVFRNTEGQRSAEFDPMLAPFDSI
jgi:hypothetical protein